MINQYKKFATEAWSTQRKNTNRKLRVLCVSVTNLFIFCILLVLPTCAKKMLPPSPDRFAPHLLEIEPLNRIKINLVFDEEINISKLTNQSFTITASNSETLKIRNLSAGNRPNTISLFTEKTKPGVYNIQGIVEDNFTNLAQINKNFKASSIIDTFPPRITEISPKLGTTKRHKNIIFNFNFSEPMDTASVVSFLVAPLKKDTIKWQWSTDWQQLTFSYPESLLPKTNVYFALQPSLQDLENNQLFIAGYTFFTTESLLPPLLVSGNLYYEDKPYKNGVVVFANDTNPAPIYTGNKSIMQNAKSNQRILENRGGTNKAFTISDIEGKFSIRLDTAIYKVTAIVDTNFDNFVDLFAEIINFNSLDTVPIKLNLLPILEGQEIDSYLGPIRNSQR